MASGIPAVEELKGLSVLESGANLALIRCEFKIKSAEGGRDGVEGPHKHLVLVFGADAHSHPVGRQTSQNDPARTQRAGCRVKDRDWGSRK